jgi:uncharacterized protein YlzI (FlbEa/FlbD family)
MNFIEFTELDGKKFIGNINLIQRVYVTNKGITAVIGWNSPGYPHFIKESYQNVLEKINATLLSINTLK